MAQIPIGIDVDSTPLDKLNKGLDTLRDDLVAVASEAKDAGIDLDRFGAEVKQGGDAARKTGQDVDGLAKRTKGAGDAAKRAKGDVDGLGRSTKQAGDSFSRAQAEAQGFLQTVNRMLGPIGGLRTLIGGIIGAAIIRDMQQFTGQIFQIQAGLTSVTGSAGAAAAEFEYLRTTADRMGQEWRNIGSAYTRFLASAKPANLELAATRDIFEGLLGASTNLGLTSYEVEGALTAISQMLSKGSVQAEELRGQLSERIPGAYQIAARAMGMTTAELSKALEDGAVSANEFVTRFGAELKAMYGDLGTASEGAAAKTNELENAMDNLRLIVAEGGFKDALITVLEFLIQLASSEAAIAAAHALGAGFGLVADAVRLLAGNLDILGPVLAGVVATLGVMAAGRLLTALTAGVTGLAGAFNLLNLSLIAAVAQQKAMAAVMAMNPWTAAAAGIGLVVTAIGLISTRGSEAERGIAGLQTALTELETDMGSLGTTLDTIGSDLDELRELHLAVGTAALTGAGDEQAAAALAINATQERIAANRALAEQQLSIIRAQRAGMEQELNEVRQALEADVKQYLLMMRGYYSAIDPEPIMDALDAEIERRGSAIEVLAAQITASNAAGRAITEEERALISNAVALGERRRELEALVTAEEDLAKRVGEVAEAAEEVDAVGDAVLRLTTTADDAADRLRIVADVLGMTRGETELLARAHEHWLNAEGERQKATAAKMMADLIARQVDNMEDLTDEQRAMIALMSDMTGIDIGAQIRAAYDAAQQTRDAVADAAQMLATAQRWANGLSGALGASAGAGLSLKNTLAGLAGIIPGLLAGLRSVASMSTTVLSGMRALGSGIATTAGTMFGSTVDMFQHAWGLATEGASAGAIRASIDTRGGWAGPAPDTSGGGSSGGSGGPSPLEELREQFKELQQEMSDFDRESGRMLQNVGREIGDMEQAVIDFIDEAERMGVPIEQILEPLGLTVEKLREMALEMDRNRAEAEKFVETVDTIATGLSDAFGDFVASGFRDFQGFVDSVTGLFKQMLADMVAQAAKTKIVSFITSNFGPGASAAGGAAQGAASGLMSSAGAALGTFGSSLWAGASGTVGGLMSGGISGAWAGATSAISGATGAIGTLGATLGAALPVIGAVVAAVSFFRTKTKELDSGLMVTADMVDTVVKTFSKVEKTRFWGLSKNTDTDYGSAEADLAKPITSAIDSIRETVLDSARAIGVARDIWRGWSAEFRVSTKDMTEDQALQAIQREFANFGNMMAEQVPGLRRFGLEGEGALDTLTRLAGSLTGVNAALKSFGFTTMDVGLRMAGAAADLAAAFGGVDQFQGALSNFVQTFYSDARQLELITTNLKRSFRQAGAVFPETREQYVRMVDGLDLNKKGHRELFELLVGNADAFDRIYPAAEQAAEAVDKLAGKLDGLRAVGGQSDAIADLMEALQLPIGQQIRWIETAAEEQARILRVEAAMRIRDAEETGESVWRIRRELALNLVKLEQDTADRTEAIRKAGLAQQGEAAKALLTAGKGSGGDMAAYARAQIVAITDGYEAQYRTAEAAGATAKQLDRVKAAFYTLPMSALRSELGDLSAETAKATKEVERATLAERARAAATSSKSIADLSAELGLGLADRRAAMREAGRDEARLLRVQAGERIRDVRKSGGDVTAIRRELAMDLVALERQTADDIRAIRSELRATVGDAAERLIEAGRGSGANLQQVARARVDAIKDEFRAQWEAATAAGATTEQLRTIRQAFFDLPMAELGDELGDLAVAASGLMDQIAKAEETRAQIASELQNRVAEIGRTIADAERERGTVVAELTRRTAALAQAETSLADARRALMSGDLAPGDERTQLREMQRQFTAAAARAAAGDAAAAGGLGGQAQALLQQARLVFGAGGDYKAMFRDVNATLVATQQAVGQEAKAAGRALDADTAADLSQTSTATLVASLKTVDGRIATLTAQSTRITEALREDTFTAHSTWSTDRLVAELSATDRRIAALGTKAEAARERGNTVLDRIRASTDTATAEAALTGVSIRATEADIRAMASGFGPLIEHIRETDAVAKVDRSKGIAVFENVRDIMVEQGVTARSAEKSLTQTVNRLDRIVANTSPANKDGKPGAEATTLTAESYRTVSRANTRLMLDALATVDTRLKKLIDVTEGGQRKTAIERTRKKTGTGG